MQNVLILYSTTDGHTQKICRRIRHILEGNKHQVMIIPISEGNKTDLNRFDKVIIGASIRYGKHHPYVKVFINNNASILKNKCNAFFSVNAVARKPEKSQPGTNPYLRKFLGKIAWRPQKTAVFGGKIDYAMYGFWDGFMIRLIMCLTKGPTAPNTNEEFTDWNEVEKFAKEIAEMKNHIQKGC